MIDFIEKALKSPAGSFAFVFALLVLAFWATYQISKWMTRLKHVDKLDDNVEKIKEDIATIKAFITVFKEANNPFAKAHSPVSLTDAGEQVAHDLKIEDLIIKHWDEINESLVNALKKDCNPYDIQQEAILIGSKIDKYLTPSELDIMKRYAFQHGHSIPMYDILIGVKIRDIYFRKHNINPEDVDKHDPNKK